MLNLDPAKLLVIAVVAVILLGPDRLPQFGRQVGSAWRTFTEFRHRVESEVRNSMPDLPPTSEIARLARSPSALLNHLSTMSSDEEHAETPRTDAGAGVEPPAAPSAPPVIGTSKPVPGPSSRDAVASGDPTLN
jgi:Sec-independent protein translocase protein TatA